MSAMLRQMATYVSFGAMVYVIDFVLFALIVLAAPGLLLLANMLGKLGGASVGYLLHGKITFAGDYDNRRAGLRYVLLFLANLAGSSLLLELAVGELGLPPLLSRIVVDAVLIAASFLISRYWVFARL